MLDVSYRLHSFTFYSQLSSRLTSFGLQKQASFSWRLIYANYYPRYNLAGKSNSTFSSKKIASMGLLIDSWHITHINKAINARNISEPKSNHSAQVTVRLGLIHHVVMYVVAFKSLPSSSVSAYLQSLLSHWHPAKLMQLLLMDWNIFSLLCMKMALCWILLHVQHTVFKVMYRSHAMCHVTSAALI